MHGRRCCHAPPLSNTACRSSISAKLTGHERLAFCLDSDLSPQPQTTALRGYLDAGTGILLSTEVPNPPMPANDKDQQLGQKPGTLGRLLPGFAIEQTSGGLQITRMLPHDTRSISLSGIKMDDHGFLVVTT